MSFPLWKYTPLVYFPVAEQGLPLNGLARPILVTTTIFLPHRGCSVAKQTNFSGVSRGVYSRQKILCNPWISSASFLTHETFIDTSRTHDQADLPIHVSNLFYCQLLLHATMLMAISFNYTGTNILAPTTSAKYRSLLTCWSRSGLREQLFLIYLYFVVNTNYNFVTLRNSDLTGTVNTVGYLILIRMSVLVGNSMIKHGSVNSICILFIDRD